MKIGILTYNSAINFGANLQACSTYCYLKSHGYEPVFINYIPFDIEGMEEKSYPNEQVAIQRSFQQQFLATEICHNSKEVAEMLDKEGISNVIIGSDAVAQHHPLISRIVFPSRHVISIAQCASNRMFPNPFWGEFLDYVKNKTNVCLMSVSNQQSRYKSFTKKERGKMMRYLNQFKFISVRDEWTKCMYKYVSNNRIVPEITPDPVFAFNQNVPFVPSKEDIMQRFGLPEKYILLALHKTKTISPSWVKSFEKKCKENGYSCVAFPFPYGISKSNVAEKRIELPLSPIDWYAIIKYSSGYVGYNMHSIVSALHNSVPCFSFDQYGIRILSQFVLKKSSKIYHILSTAGFANYRAPSHTVINLIPKPGYVFDMLMGFDKEKCRSFAECYYDKYLIMMHNIESSFI